jgi:uncharacterized protein (DUF1800 family)
VARLRDVFRKSDGDLRALTAALLDSDEAWQVPLTKLRSPYEFLVAAGRLLGQIPEDPTRYLGGLNVLGQPLWSPAGPNGFPDSNAAWAAPEGMKLRLDISAQMPPALPPMSTLAICWNSPPPMRPRRKRGAPSSLRNRGSRRWRCC